MLTTSNARAYAVLATMYANHEMRDVMVAPYLNGREDGFAIRDRLMFNKIAAFAQYRNTDQIVVYLGESINFEMAGNVPDEATYANRTCFDPDDYAAAAAFVYNHVCGEVA